MNSSLDNLPNGVLVILDPETGQWKMSVNRVKRAVMTDEIYSQMFAEAKQWLQEARDQGLPVVDPDDEEGIRERLPKVGELAPLGLESAERILDGGLEEAAMILPNLWGWLTGLDEDPWEPSDQA